MANKILVMAQANTATQTRTATTKAIAGTVVTLTTTAAHSASVGYPVTVSESARSYTVSFKSLTSNTAMLTVSSHRIAVGDSITVASVDATFNGTFTVSSTTATTISYPLVATNVASVASAGTISSLDKTFNGTYTVTSIPSTTTLTYTNVGTSYALPSPSGTVSVVYVPWAAVYTCPAATAAVTSTIVICNTGLTAATYGICVSANSSNPVTKEAIAYGDAVSAQDSVFLTLGITLDATVKNLMFIASSPDVAINVFGTEIT